MTNPCPTCGKREHKSSDECRPIIEGPTPASEPSALELLCQKCVANGTDSTCEHFGPQVIKSDDCPSCGSWRGVEAHGTYCPEREPAQPAEPREWDVNAAREILHEYRQPNSLVDLGNLYFAATELSGAYDALAAENAKYIARNEELRATQFAAISDQAREIEKLKAERDHQKRWKEDEQGRNAKLSAEIARLSRELEEAKGRIQREESARFEGERLLKAARAEVEAWRSGATAQALTRQRDRYREALEAIRAALVECIENIAYHEDDCENHLGHAKYAQEALKRWKEGK